jgi:CubicO group peptidase (beta-lactamase class C family)
MARTAPPPVPTAEAAPGAGLAGSSSRPLRFGDPEAAVRWAFPDAPRRREAARRLAAKLAAQLDVEHDRGATGPGFSFALVVDGDVVLRHANGLADVEGGRAATPETIYRIASITKTFTATAVMALRDEGRLATSDPLSAHLPELDAVYPHRDSSPIRIEQVLTHSAGLARSGRYAELARPSTEADLVDAMALPLADDPGIAHHYSNLGFGLLGLMAGRTAGMPYRELIRTRLLAPLGMTSSAFDVAALPHERVAISYERDGSPIQATANGAAEGAGGMWSTAPDLARWIRFQLAAWPPRDDPDDGPVRRATLREMQMPRVPIAMIPGAPRAHALSVGLAWEITTGCYFDRLVGHDGVLEGFRSALRLDVDRALGFVLLTNSEAADVRGIAERLLDTIATEDLLARRRREPAPALVARVEDVLRRLGSSWTDADHEEAFTGGLRKDLGRADAVALGRRIDEDAGSCRYARAESVDDALDAELSFECARGALRVVARASGKPLRLAAFKVTFVRPDAKRPRAPRCLR